MAYVNVDNINSDIKHNLFPPTYACLVKRFAELVDSIDVSRFPMQIDFLLLPDRYRYSYVDLRINSQVKHRDTGLLTDISATTIVSVEELRYMDSQVLTALIYEGVRKLVIHELDECFMVGGNRIYDPHREDYAKTKVV